MGKGRERERGGERERWKREGERERKGETNGTCNVNYSPVFTLNTIILCYLHVSLTLYVRTKKGE